MADVTEIIDYYVNLLIVQYHNKPKAIATIGLFSREMLANGVIFDIEDGFNINDPSAIGVQLDIIGKYVGVDRFFSLMTLENFFSFTDYIESPPASPPRFGFSDYADYDDYAYNGTLTYSDLIATANKLYDEDFLVLIKLKIISNNSNFSHSQIDAQIYEFFGDTIRPESLNNMTMVYFISSTITPLMQAVIAKNLLPHPMGVGTSVVNDVRGDMFAFTDYSGYESPYGYGFSEYSNYDSLAGQVLTYNQITGV